MRHPRIKAPADEAAVYHCVTRTVNGQFLFEDADKEILRKQLAQAAEFSGVQVLTFCLLSNHFHLLVRVPEVGEISDAELLRRYRILYPKRPSGPKAAQYAQVGGVVLGPDRCVEDLLAAGGEEAAKLRASITRRMGDVSEFMKTAIFKGQA